MYNVVWKYRVSQEHRDNYEQHYGPNGVWAALFRNSASYRGSLLYRDNEEAGNYLLMDQWNDRASYEAFLQEYRRTYDSLSREMEYIYLEETKVGVYDLV